MKFDQKYKELIPGGMAKGMSIKDIAKETKVSLKRIKDELKKGTEVEKEHTTDSDIAKEIARDHTVEDPEYYTRLKKIE